MKTLLHPKPLLVAATVLGALIVSSNSARANLLANGNLDQTELVEVVPGFSLPQPAMWVNDGSKSLTGPFKDDLSSETWAGPAPTPVTAEDYGVFFKAFQGSLDTFDLVSARLYQDVPGTPGLTYVLSGWAGAEANYSGLILGSPQTQTLFRLSFLDAGNSVLGGAELDLVAAGLGTANGQPFNYKQYALSAVAPDGTVSVRAEVAMIDGYANPDGGGQAFVVDDFDLSVPEPGSCTLIGLGVAALFAFRRRA